MVYVEFSFSFDLPNVNPNVNQEPILAHFL